MGDEPIDIDLNKFEAFLAVNRFGSRHAAREYLHACSYERPLTLQELEAASADALIRKYFDYDSQARAGTLKPHMPRSQEPAFIALLIDLGYVVGRGDYAPIMMIHAP